MKKSSLLNNASFQAVLASAASVFAGLAVGFIVLSISDSVNSGRAIATIVIGGFNNGMRSIGTVLVGAIPVILTGLSVTFAFRTGIFNIGAPGQFIVGAFSAIYVGVKWTFLPEGLHWIVALLASVLAGALWGVLPGLLYAYLNVNVVITTIMMNYIGMFTVNYLISSYILNAAANKSLAVAQSALIPKMGLDKIFAGSPLSGALYIAIITAVILYILIEKTAFGYELRACGSNRDASRYAGINDKKCLLLSLVIASALAGLGGGLLYLGEANNCIMVNDVLASEGFTGISVALLGQCNPIGVFFAGLFIAHLDVGGFYAQRFGYPTEIIDIIVSIIIFCSALTAYVMRRIARAGLNGRRGR